jgi:FkbM family methyltransferase
LAGIDWLNRRLPWWWWRRLCAYDSLAVAWFLGVRARRPLSFVQVGSNDGVVFDPLHAVVKACGWTGVLIEPMPDLFARLVDNYEGTPGLIFENVAIGERDGDARIFSVEARPDDPYWVNQLASFDREVILSHRDKIPDLASRVVEVPVTALTLPSLVAKHRLTVIDLLHMDVEGFDYEVIKQIDFEASWAPKYLIFERQHMDHQTHAAVSQLLQRAGYRLVDLWPDQLAFRSSVSELGSARR